MNRFSIPAFHEANFIFLPLGFSRGLLFFLFLICISPFLTFANALAVSSKTPPHNKSRAGLSLEKKPFQNLAKNPSELVAKALDCLNRGDTLGLYNLSIVREEYIQLYPFLPRADTTSVEDRDFRMGYFLMDNRKMIFRKFENHGRANLQFSRLAFLGEKEARGRFSFHHGLHIWVLKGGKEIELVLAKSLISVDGGWKFWGYSGD